MPSAKLSIESRAVDLAIIQQPRPSELQLPSTDSSVSPASLDIPLLSAAPSLEQQLLKCEDRLKQLSSQLDKQRQFSFILSSYFNKIEKVIYNSSTDIFHKLPINYEKLELYLREIIRRLQDTNNRTLSAPPNVYKKGNVKVSRLAP